jgi:hypothetical protein
LKLGGKGALCGSFTAMWTIAKLPRLSKNLPHDWSEQRRFLGFAA